MDQEAGEGDGSEDEQEEAADEEGDTSASLAVGLGDAEGVDEGIGKEIEETHGIIMRAFGSIQAAGLWVEGLHPRVGSGI
jgi:hypothetical protein